MALAQSQKELLRPHAQHFEAMAGHVFDCSDEELADLLLACDAADETNCPWSIYRAARFLRQEVENQFNVREKRRAALASAKDPSR
jgi:hypothetical protein